MGGHQPQNTLDLKAGFEKAELLKQNIGFEAISSNQWLRQSKGYETKLKFFKNEFGSIELHFDNAQDLALYQNAHWNSQIPYKGRKLIKTPNGALLDISQ